MIATDYTPKADKAEWHLTYRCDLSCTNCNRACFLPAQTPDMTLADAEEFCRQADELDWRPRIMLIGGEPTLHPQFLDFVRLANRFSPCRAEVWSNGHSARAQDLLDEVRDWGAVKVIEGTRKPAGSVEQPVQDIFLAPQDFGVSREPCGTHSCFADPDCGISVDAGGYTLCCMGGAIDGILQLGVRTRRLADLFDPDFARRQTRALCDCCGQHLGCDVAKQTRSEVRCGTRMSATWLAAVDRIQAKKKEPVIF